MKMLKQIPFFELCNLRPSNQNSPQKLNKKWLQRALLQYKITIYIIKTIIQNKLYTHGKRGQRKQHLNNGSSQTIYKANSQTNLISVSSEPTWNMSGNYRE